MPRQPRRSVGLHIRGQSVAGDTTRLNEKAVKILAELKTATHSLGLDELKEKTSFSEEDIVRQVKLLIDLKLVKSARGIPLFPTSGWKVFTEPAYSSRIKQILHQHGIEVAPEPALHSCDLGGYHPIGLALEGTGFQTNNGRSYPPDVPENEDLEYKQETLETMIKWRDEIQPFKPKDYSPENVRLRLQKFKWLTDRLADIYGIPKPTLVVGRMDAATWSADLSSGSSCYSRASHTITLDGKFSVITLLHEFGHARGFDETDTTMWSANLFKRIFPKSYSRLQGQGHCLIRQQMPAFNPEVQ